MKNLDITQSVMKTIALKERKRIVSFKRKLFISIGILISAFTIIGIVVIRILQKQKTFDLFTLAREDWEIISEYWIDTALSFLQELPQLEVALSGIVLCIIFLIVFISKNKRDITRRKEKEIRKYL